MSPRGHLRATHTKLCKDAIALMSKKNHDYGGKGEDLPFRNFDLAPALGICSAELGMVIRLSDKISRLATFFKDGELQVTEETLRDTCMDIVNYSGLILASWTRNETS